MSAAFSQLRLSLPTAEELGGAHTLGIVQPVGPSHASLGTSKSALVLMRPKSGANRIIGQIVEYRKYRVAYNELTLRYVKNAAVMRSGKQETGCSQFLERDILYFGLDCGVWVFCNCDMQAHLAQSLS